MRARTGEIDVAQPLATHLCLRYFHATLIADHAAMLHALVFSAEAFPIGYRAKNARAKKSIALWLKRAVVNRLRLGNLAMRPLPDFVRRRQRDSDCFKVGS